ncbi:MAG: hypothetical protein NT031_13425, partial [Planctomycetota bacterium]|nr:hypothetical protein [Planctomycetota bacterium]
MANYCENPDVGPARPDWNVVMAAVAGLAGAWLAAGDAGLLGHALRHALTWVALGGAVVAGWPGLACPGERTPAWWRSVAARTGILLVALAFAVGMTASDSQPVNVLAAPLVLGVLGWLFRQNPGGRQAGRVLSLAGLAAAALGVYRLACTSMPLVWQGSDAVGAAIGRAGGTLAGVELSVGATFAGLDYLVLMGALYAGWLVLCPAPRRGRALVAAAFILGGHAVYLIVLAHATDLLKLLPLPPERPPTALPWNQEPWSFAAALRSMLPWNLPALAGLIHLSIAGGMLRAPLARCPVNGDLAPADPWHWRRGVWAAWAAAIVGACLLPIFSNLTCGQADLEGKKIVGYEKGFVNWLKPQHGPNVSDYGHYSVGMYGMLPVYVDTLGGSFVLSPELSQKDMAGADVVLMMYPNAAWTSDRLRRLHAFVRQGGSLLIFGEHTIRQADGRSRFNDVLELFADDSDTVPEPLIQMADLFWLWEQREKHLTDLRIGLPASDAHGDLTAAGRARAGNLIADLSKTFGHADLTADDLGRPEKKGRLQKLAAAVHRRWARRAPMQVPFDSALFEVGGWLQSYDALAHPATSGLRDDRNQFGAVI